MSAIASIALTLALAAFPFIMMPLLWRRMKRVRAQTYRAREQEPQVQPWAEPLATRDGLTLERESSPNDALIALGDRANHARWPLTNE
jgi:hypothetical protein